MLFVTSSNALCTLSDGTVMLPHTDSESRGIHIDSICIVVTPSFLVSFATVVVLVER